MSLVKPVQRPRLRHVSVGSDTDDSQISLIAAIQTLPMMRFMTNWATDCTVLPVYTVYLETGTEDGIAMRGYTIRFRGIDL